MCHFLGQVSYKPVEMLTQVKFFLTEGKKNYFPSLTIFFFAFKTGHINEGHHGHINEGHHGHINEGHHKFRSHIRYYTLY